ncbi:MAG: hypothetical protein ACXWQQ_04085 [Pseudobdellovibrio sp.]
MIKYLAIAIVFYTVVTCGIGFLYVNQSFAISIAMGCATVLINVGGLAVFWRLIFSKKHIALASVIIIFKYLILAVILWSLYAVKWLNPAGFCIGLASLLFSIFVLLIVKQFSKNIY